MKGQFDYAIKQLEEITGKKWDDKKFEEVMEISAGFCGARQSDGRCHGALRTFRRVFPAERILTVHADFDRGSARSALRALADRLDVRAVFCANDLMALGALEAFEERGMKPPPIGGVDAIPEAREAVLQGRLAGTAGIAADAVVRGVYDRRRLYAGRRRFERQGHNGK